MKIFNCKDFIKDNLSGLGLEIGASTSPLSYNPETTSILYQDRIDMEQRKAEIILYDKNVNPQDLVKPSIISDATTCPFSDDYFDFVCNSHLLEHLANPIKAILEWLRVTKKGGYVYFIVPDKRFTFDKERACTMVLHLIEDYEEEIEKVAFEHYQEAFGDKATEHMHHQTNFHVHTFTDVSINILLEWMKMYVTNSFSVECITREGINIAVLLRKI